MEELADQVYHHPLKMRVPIEASRASCLTRTRFTITL